MESKELYWHLLGINEPWRVERVDLDMTRGQVDVYVGHAKGVRFACPECGQEHAVYDHSAERVWRHLDSCQFMTYLHASPPRVSCSEHGVRQAREGSRFTHLFEALRELWNYTSTAWALKFWKRWYYWATHSRLQPMIDAAKLIARHLPNVLTYFKHRITNAVAEGLNSKIATVQKRACGFRNRDHFKIAIYFHCGGLDLYPAQVTHGKVG